MTRGIGSGFGLSLENAGQRPESFQELLGEQLGVPARDGIRQEQFQQLVILQRRFSAQPISSP